MIRFGLCMLLLGAVVSAVDKNCYDEERQCFHGGPEAAEKCLEASAYDGTMAKTRSGKTCQAWSADQPHKHIFKTLPNNYCRNPDNEPRGAWCFTTDESVLWEPCFNMCDTPTTTLSPTAGCMLPRVPNSNHALSKVIPFGSTTNFFCSPGYRLNGASRIGCFASGAFNPTVPSCDKIAGECVDDNVLCSMITAASDECKNTAIRENCRKTCKVCVPPEECKNEFQEDCELIPADQKEEMCKFSELKLSCAKFCGECSTAPPTTTTAPPEDCKNNMGDSECASVTVGSSFCSIDSIKEGCAKACGVCGGPPLCENLLGDATCKDVDPLGFGCMVGGAFRLGCAKKCGVCGVTDCEDKSAILCIGANPFAPICLDPFRKNTCPRGCQIEGCTSGGPTLPIPTTTPKPCKDNASFNFCTGVGSPSNGVCVFPRFKENCPKSCGICT